MLQAPVKSGHSSIVELTLEHGQTVIKLAQVGPDFVIARPPAELPPGEVVIVVSVDGRIHRNRALLPQGMSVAIDLTPIQLLQS